jgi:uncharacterized protein YceK
MSSRLSQLSIVLCLAGASSACGTVVTLQNPQTGATATCEAGHLQLASEEVKQALLTRCVDGYTRQGYEVVANSK